MDSDRPKSFNSKDTYCQISICDDDDEDSTDPVNLSDCCLLPRTSNGTVSSSDNYSFSENMSPYSIGPLRNDNGRSNSYAKAQFERQLAQKAAIDTYENIDKCKHLRDFGGNRDNGASKYENPNELEETGASETAEGSVYQVDEYNELVQKKNSEFFDEELSCESDEEQENEVEEQENEVVGSCCGAESEYRAEYNWMVHDRNTEQFDEVLSVNSDEDLVENAGLPQSGYSAVDEPLMHISNSKRPEDADSDFQGELPKSEGSEETNGYDAATHRNAYSSKYSGAIALHSLDRCNKLLSTYGYAGARCSTVESETKGEVPKSFTCFDQESEVPVSCRSGYLANPPEDQEDASEFCERSSEINILHQPFISQQDDLRSERGTGDWHYRGNSLQSSGLRGYPTPQYHLTRYGFGSEFDQPHLLTSRYYQLQQRRHARRERRDAAVVDSADVPGYKGNLDVEELLSYINDSKGLGHRSEEHGTVEASASRPAEKGGKKRKKGGSKGQERRDKLESSFESTDKRPGDIEVAVENKTNENVRSVSKTNCVETASGDRQTVSDTSQTEEIVSDSVSKNISDASLALKETCDIPQGSMDSSRTDRQLEKSLMQSSSSPLLRFMSEEFSLQSAAAIEDDFTMVMKKKKLKKNSTKRSNLPDTGCLPHFHTSGDSATLTSTVHEFFSPSPATLKDLYVDCHRTKTRHGVYSKSSNGFKPMVDNTVTQASGLYLGAQGEKVGSEVLKKLAVGVDKAVDVCSTMSVQSISTAAAGIRDSKRIDSVASRSTGRRLTSQGKLTLQNREKQEAKKSLTGVESLHVPLRARAGALLENGVKQVAAEKQRNSRWPSTDQSKDLSVEKLEISPSGQPQNLLQDNVTKPQNLSKDENVKPQKRSQDEEVISDKLVQDETCAVRDVSQKLLEDEVALSESPTQDVTIVVCQKLSVDEMVISETSAEDEIDASQELLLDEESLPENTSRQLLPDEESLPRSTFQELLPDEESLPRNTSQQLLPDEESLPRNGSLDDALLLSAQAASVEGASLSDVPPSEQPVVFLDRQRGLFSVPTKKDLGLKFGHFDDCDTTPDESRTLPSPGPVNFIHYIPVPYHHEDGHDRPITDSLMFPIMHQYAPQLMYTNGTLQPLCKPAFQMYPNGHVYPVPMHFAQFLPPGLCVLPHTTNVPVGVVSPTMNNRSREETFSSESADSPIITDASDSCMADFAAMQSNLVPMEPVARPYLLPEPSETVVANVSRSSLKRCKTVFELSTAVEFLHSEWLNVTREENEPNSGVVRYNPDLDV